MKISLFEPHMRKKRKQNLFSQRKIKIIFMRKVETLRKIGKTKSSKLFVLFLKS